MPKLKLKQLTLPLTIFIVVCAWFGYQQFNQSLETNSKAENISKLKTVNTALLSYYSKEHKYPDKLQELLDTGYITEDQLALEDYDLHYVKSIEIVNGNAITIYAKEKDGDHTLNVNIDGSISPSHITPKS